MSRRRIRRYRAYNRQPTDPRLSISFLFTSALFIALAALTRNDWMKTHYDRVLRSLGVLSFGQSVESWISANGLVILLAFVVTWLVVLILILRLSRRSRAVFDFGDNAGAFSPTDSSPYLDPRRSLYHLTPEQFEEAVAALIRNRTGFHARVVGGAYDKGVDIKVYDAQKGLVGVVQCKRYHPRKYLPPMFIREMATVKQMNQVNIAYLATTARFSADSRYDAEQLGVRLIDGSDLTHMLQPRHREKRRRQQTAAPQTSPTPASFHAPSPGMNDAERIQEQLRQRREKLSKR